MNLEAKGGRKNHVSYKWHPSREYQRKMLYDSGLRKYSPNYKLVFLKMNTPHFAE